MIKIFKDPYPHFEELKKQLVGIATDLKLGDLHVNPDGQIAIQTRNPEQRNWTDGIGASLPGKNPKWEQEFCHLQYDLVGTPIADYIAWLETPVYRTRIMVAREKTSYSIHKDYTPRLHLPLVTNEQCNFLFTDPLMMQHLPADGSTYWTDTRKYHTFLNGSTEQRLHLVMIVEN